LYYPNLGLMIRASRADLLGKALEGSTTDMSQLLSRGHVVVSQGDAHTNSSSALKNLKEIKINTNTMSYYERSPLRRQHIILHLVTTYCLCIPYTTPVRVRMKGPGPAPCCITTAIIRLKVHPTIIIIN